jgi:hypothetical protein
LDRDKRKYDKHLTRLKKKRSKYKLPIPRMKEVLKIYSADRTKQCNPNTET